jgi:hypothetical protein
VARLLSQGHIGLSLSRLLLLFLSTTPAAPAAAAALLLLLSLCHQVSSTSAEADTAAREALRRLDLGSQWERKT